jgi:hypothetical protein
MILPGGIANRGVAKVTRRELLALGATATALHAQRSSESVGAARDLMYQALELLSGHATPDQVTRAVRFLRGALDQYPSFGDAHYYRALCLKRLNQDAALQRSELRAAETYKSEALRDMRDPFAVAVPSIAPSLAAVGQKWALVVGISQFNPDAGAETLKYSATDAKAFAELLGDPAVGRFPPNQVFALTNAMATAAAIKARLNFIATRAKADDIVVVYVSTHGSARTDDLRGVSYLYTYDTDVTSRDQIFGTALAMWEISNIIATRCLAQRTLVIFDTCHSGAGIASQALSGQDIDRLREGGGRYVVSSCQDDQRSYEDAGHGLFTASLIAHLRERKGCVRVTDLFATVQKDVSERALRVYKKDQKPVMASSQNASEIVLGSPPGGAGCTARA